MSNQANPNFYEYLANRRSASVLHEPKPSKTEIEKILAIAGTVPDHGNLQPYRFVVIEDTGRDKFGDSLVDAANAHRPEPLEEKVKPKIRAKAFAAPMQILIIYSPVPSEKIHAWEQMAAASCTGFALVLAANALGYGAVWKSFAYDPGPMLKSLVGLTSEERVLGWVNIGTEKERDHAPREGMAMVSKVRYLGNN